MNRRAFASALAAAVSLPALLAVPVCAGKGDFNPRFEEVREAIIAILNGPDRLELPVERVRDALRAHYIDNQGNIYWVGTGRLTPLIQRLGRAEYDGLFPEDYPIETLVKFRDALSRDDIHGAAYVEIYASAIFIAYVADLKIGRLIPQRVDSKLFRTRKTIDVLRVLTDLKTYPEPSQFLASFEPRNPQYRALKGELPRYYGIVAKGGWGAIAVDDTVLKPGMSEPRVAQIRNYLRLTGDHEWNDGESTLYDDQLAISVTRFQKRHGLEAMGTVGKQTLLAMNVPADERARQIMLTMERWRWMPDDPGEYYFLVNLAAFELQRIQSNIVIERMNVVVGAVATSTSEFSDEMEYIEFNPTWTVPYSIATKEMLPKLRRNPFAYAADFEVFVNGQLTGWGGIDWQAYGTGNFPVTFRQKPGPKNALGKVKFMLPNKHNIYLHDTPAKEKFLQTTRAFSHGCIRLSRPLDLALTVGIENAGWSARQIKAALDSGKTTRASLKTRIPVHLMYATAFIGDADTIEFRPDVYGRDRKLYNALFGKPTA